MGLFGRKKQPQGSPASTSSSAAGAQRGTAPTICDPKDLVVTLFPPEAFDGPPGYEVVQPLPGLVAPITIDENEGMRAQWGNLDKVGMSAADAYARAFSNLSALPVELSVIEDPSESEIHTTVHFLSADDGYASGRIFLVPEILQSVGEDFPEEGVLVCVPNAFTMALHVPRDIGVIGGMSKLMEIAQGEFKPELNGITPHVFVVQPNANAVQCTQIAEDGTMQMDATSGPLHSILVKCGVINT